MSAVSRPTPSAGSSPSTPGSGVDVASLSDTDDLYGAGMTSHASVTVMLACEDEWDLEFPQQMLKKSTFASVANIRDALGELGVDDASVASA